MFEWRPMKLCFAAALVATWTATTFAGDAVPPPVPTPKPQWQHWEVAEETGALFGVNNPNDYQTLPQIFSIRWQWAPEEQFFHTPFLLRWQYTFGLVATPFVHGAENYYFGLAVGRRMSFRKPGSRFGAYAEGRFAVGTTDSHGPPNGQGEDMTFNALATVGVTYDLSSRARLGAGFMYEHFSNGGFSEPEAENIGLDTIGPSLSLQWTF